MYRPDKNEYYMMIAVATSLRSPCVRRKVGAVIVKDDAIVSTGYNGGVRGYNNCLGEEACKNGGSGCQTTIHAESNAILHANRKDMIGATMFVTTNPCQSCYKLIANAGISNVYYLSKYREGAHLGGFGVEVEQLDISEEAADGCHALFFGWENTSYPKEMSKDEYEHEVLKTILINYRKNGIGSLTVYNLMVLDGFKVMFEVFENALGELVKKGLIELPLDAYSLKTGYPIKYIGR